MKLALAYLKGREVSIAEVWVRRGDFWGQQWGWGGVFGCSGSLMPERNARVRIGVGGEARKGADVREGGGVNL